MKVFLIGLSIFVGLCWFFPPKNADAAKLAALADPSWRGVSHPVETPLAIAKTDQPSALLKDVNCATVRHQVAYTVNQCTLAGDPETFDYNEMAGCLNRLKLYKSLEAIACER
jgi:hypothetical protein